jgi:hypothetical protein
LEKRKNVYPISEPLTPTAAKSAGIYQYGPDYSYFLRAEVGSNKQPFYMLLDTGAANTWLMGSNCQSGACQMHNTFDPSSSKSWQTENKPLKIHYGTGDLRGIVGHDTATIAGMTHNFEFGLAEHTHDDFKHFAFDGILGLGLSDSVSGTWLKTLKDQNVLSSMVFGMTLNRGSDEVNDGQITFGGVDKAKFTGDISYTDIPSPRNEWGHWMIPLGGVSFDGKEAKIASSLASIDSGTSFIFAPLDDLQAIFDLIPGSRGYQNDLYREYEVPCDTKTPIALTFSGVKYEISAKDWVMRKTDDKCIANLYAQIKGGLKGEWLVGDTFLKNVYTVFDGDKMRIGFASKAAAPKPTTTSVAGPAATTSAGTVTSSADGGDVARPVMPGLSRAGDDGAQTPEDSSDEHTEVNSGSRLGGGFYVSALCIAAVVAMLG